MEVIKSSKERREEYMKKGKDDMNQTIEQITEITQQIKSKIKEIQTKGEQERTEIKGKLESQLKDGLFKVLPTQEQEETRNSDPSTEKGEGFKQKGKYMVDRLKVKWGEWEGKRADNPNVVQSPSNDMVSLDVNDNEPQEKK